MCKHTRRFIFFHELLGRVQFHFQSETEQSFLYDFRFCYFIVFQSALSLRSSAFFKTLNLVGTCYLNPCFAKRMLGSINDTNYVRFISNLQRFPKPFDANKFALSPTSNCLPDSLSYAEVGVQKVWETFWSGRYRLTVVSSHHSRSGERPF